MGNACAVTGRIENGNSASLLTVSQKAATLAAMLKIQCGGQLATSFSMLYVSTHLDCQLHLFAVELLTFDVRGRPSTLNFHITDAFSVARHTFGMSSFIERENQNRARVKPAMVYFGQLYSGQVLILARFYCCA